MLRAYGKRQTSFTTATGVSERKQSREKKKWQRRFWTAVAVSQVIILMTVLALHLLGHIDFARSVQSSIAAISGIAIAYLGYRMQSTKPEPGSTEEKKRLKIAYILLGGWLGLIAAFLGPVLIILLSRFLGGPALAHAQGGGELAVFLVVIGPVIGALAGYHIGKRNGFGKPKWMTWIDDKFGF